MGLLSLLPFAFAETVRAEDAKDPFARVRCGDAAPVVPSLCEGYKKGTLDPWTARLYQDLRLEAGEKAALVDETKAAFPEPRAPMGQWLLARLSEKKDLDFALQRVLPSMADPTPAILDQGWAALACDKLPHATALVARVRKLAAGREEAALYEARVLEANGDRSAGQRVLAAFCAAHLDAIDARRAWSEMLAADHHRGDAVAVIDEALARGRTTPLLISRAALAIEFHDLEMAKRCLDEAKDGGRPMLRAEALALRSALRLASKDLPGADASAEEALKACARSPQALRAKARSLEAAGKYTEAVRRLDAAIDIEPTWARLYVDRGAALAKSGQAREAKKSLMEAKKRDADDLEAVLFLGVLAEDEGDWAAAEKAYRTVIKADGDHLLAHRMLAGTLFVLAKLEQADVEAGWVLDRDPKDSAAWFMRGRVALRQDRYDDALVAFKKATEGDPSYGLGPLGTGWTYEAQNKTDEAKKAYEAAIAADPKLALAHRYLAELLEDLADPSGALKHYKAYLDLGGDDPDEDVRHSVERLTK